MIALLGRFFLRCIEAAENPPNGIRVDAYDPSFMTDQEISDFLHGRVGKINWERVKMRRRLGLCEDPWSHQTSEGAPI